MRRVLVTILTIAVIAVMVSYVAGALTREVRREDSCVLCRAVRYSEKQYGLHYERVEDTVMTEWYRANVDPRHGTDPSHPHTWQQSASTMVGRAGRGEQEAQPALVAPIFLLRPEIERAALQRIPDKQTQVSLIQSLNTPVRRDAMRRVQRLIEFFYIDQFDHSWAAWWQKHRREFELPVKR